MLVADLQQVLERLAPTSLAQPGDNSGLLVGDERAPVHRVLAALELTPAVLEEALASSFDTILTHHPLLFVPVRSLVESNPREALLRRLAAEHVTLIACHTNVDSAPGGLADIAADALGLRDVLALDPASAGWYKLVVFIPAEAVDQVAAAVFAAGAGGIGAYSECAFVAQGTGWFTPGAGSHPTIGQVARPERTPEARWETVVPHARLAGALRALAAVHPYEEPAFDIYPVEDVVPHAGLGRVGSLDLPVTVSSLAQRAARTFELSVAAWSGDGERLVSKVGVLPGSGRSLVDSAAGLCDVLITGDLGYHEADRALEMGLSLIDVPHGEFERWAFTRWVTRLGSSLTGSNVTLAVSERWQPPWRTTQQEPARRGTTKDEVPVPGPPSSLAETDGQVAPPERVESGGGAVRIWIDGGSRGNPGLSAIGVLLEDARGNLVDTMSRVIGVATNNVAEYQALLVALEMAQRAGATDVEVVSDSELLVKQLKGEYKVKNEGLRGLFLDAIELIRGFANFTIRHVERAQNARADELVNRALDEYENAGL